MAQGPVLQCPFLLQKRSLLDNLGLQKQVASDTQARDDFLAGKSTPWW